MIKRARERLDGFDRGHSAQRMRSSTHERSTDEVRSTKYEVRSRTRICVESVVRDLCFMKFYPPGAVYSYARTHCMILDLPTVCSPIFTAKWHWGARILRNFDPLTRARARAVHNMSPATAPCARAPGGAMRAPGSRCIFTVLAISGGRGPLAGWLAGWLAD